MTKWIIGKVTHKRFEVIDIKRGGMGVVYLCLDREKGGAPIAVKTFQDRYLNSWRVREMFRQEAMTWVSLGKQPNIIQAYEVEIIEGKPHALIEFVGGAPGLGADLRSWIVHRRVGLKEALKFGIHICKGMEQALKRVPKLVHRDLKPENILVTSDEVAKVTDFGLAKALLSSGKEIEKPKTDEITGEILHTSLGRVGEVVGTPPYMSPEQWRGKNVGIHSDIYALGCILFELITGERVFTARSIHKWQEAHTKYSPRRPKDLRPDLPEALDEIVWRCLRKQPYERPADFELIEDTFLNSYEMLFGVFKDISGIQESVIGEELVNIGKSFALLGRNDKAISYYEQALSLTPDYWKAWHNKGLSLLMQGQSQRSLHFFEQAVKLNPDQLLSFVMKGLAFQQLNKPNEALFYYDRVLELEPQNIYALINKALLLENLGKYQAATALIEQALQVDPWSHTALFTKMRLMKQSLDSEEQSRLWLKVFRSAITPQEIIRAFMSLPDTIAPSVLDEVIESIDLFLSRVYEFPDSIIYDLYSTLPHRIESSFGQLAFGRISKFDKINFDELIEEEQIFRDFVKMMIIYGKIQLLANSGRIDEAISVSKNLENEGYPRMPKEKLSEFHEVLCFLYEFVIILPSVTLVQVDRYTQALRCLDEVSPNFALSKVLVEFARSVSFFMTGHFEAAVEHIDELLSLPERRQIAEIDDATLLYLKGDSLRNLGKIDEALNILKEARKSGTDDKGIKQGIETSLMLCRKNEV